MVEYKKGYFARSLAGHDKGQLYIIIEEKGKDGSSDYVYLADGRLKSVERPKRKKIKHIQVIKREDARLKSLIEQGRPIRNEDVKYAIKTYANTGEAPQG